MPRPTRSTRTSVLLAATALVLTVGLTPGAASATGPAPAAGTARGAGSAPAVGVVPAAVDTGLAGDIVFSTPSGTFQGELTVSLSTTVAGAQLRYTTDGSAPTASSAVYSSPVRLTRSTEIRAQAFVGGTATGTAGSAQYVATAVTTAHDLPVVVLDSYGAGAATDDYKDVALLELQPGAGGTTNLAASPALTTRAAFHLRGQSSRMFGKTPLRLELRGNDGDDLDLPVLGMPAESDWVLRGPFPDKALVRDALVLDLGRDMGMAAPRYEFVELYVNTDAQPVASGDYLGVYMLMETIKNQKNRLDLKKLNPEDVTSPRVEGGYVFKFEWLASEEPRLTCTGNAATCWQDLEVHDPDDLAPAQRQWLNQHVQAFHDVLHGPGYADPTTGYAAYIDVDSFVDQVIVNELSREMDAYIRSQYFFKDRGGKITAGPLWDFNLSFGVGGFFQNDQVQGWQYQQARQPVGNDWFTVLMKDPAFVNRVKVRWQDLRRGLLSDARLQTRISGLTTPLTAAAARNFARWPNLTTRSIGPFVTSTNPTWTGQVQEMQGWLTRRAAWLDSAQGWGGPTTPVPTPGPTTTPTPTPTPTVTPTPNPTPDPGQGGCSAVFTATNQWPGGFQGDVTVTAGSAPVSGWTVTLTFAPGQSLTQTWNAAATTSGATVTARSLAWNGSLAAGARTSFGFTGTTSGAGALAPAVTCTAG